MKAKYLLYLVLIVSSYHFFYGDFAMNHALPYSQAKLSLIDVLTENEQPSWVFRYPAEEVYRSHYAFKAYAIGESIVLPNGLTYVTTKPFQRNELIRYPECGPSQILLCYRTHLYQAIEGLDGPK